MSDNQKRGETPQDHELRMREWKKQDEAAIAAGKMITEKEFPKLFQSPCGLPKLHLLN